MRVSWIVTERIPTKYITLGLLSLMIGLGMWIGMVEIGGTFFLIGIYLMLVYNWKPNKGGKQDEIL